MRKCKACDGPVGYWKQFCEECRITRKRARENAKAARERAFRPARPPKALVVRPLVQSWPVSPGTSGAICELLVAADLLRRGYHVFRAVSPSCPCDLLAMRDNLSARVEVRKVTRAKHGGIDSGIESSVERSRFDVLARVELDGTIHYNGLEKLDG